MCTFTNLALIGIVLFAVLGVGFICFICSDTYEAIKAHRLKRKQQDAWDLIYYSHFAPKLHDELRYINGMIKQLGAQINELNTKVPNKKKN